MKKRWLYIAPALVVPFIGTLFYFVVFKDSLFVQAFFATTKVFTFTWPVIALWLLKELKDNSFFRQLGISWRQFGIGLVSGGIIVLTMYLLMLSPLGDIVRASSGKMQEKVAAMGVEKYFILFGLAVSFLHSLLEEYYWRWFVFGQLKKSVPIAFAHIIAGIAFASHHLIVTLQYFPTLWAWIFAGLVGVGGIFWSVLYDKTQSLFAAWVCHVIVDLGIFWVGYQVIFGA